MTDILKERFPTYKVPKRRSEEGKMRVLRRNLMARGQSLVHRKVYDKFPKERGLFCKKFSFWPSSYQTSAGKKMQNGIIENLKNNPKIKEIYNQIGSKAIEILLLYHLAKTKKRRDIDNYNKNIIDSLRKGGLFEDDSQVKFLASKIEYIEVKDTTYYRAWEAATVRVDLFNENNALCASFNKILCGDNS